MGMQSEWTLGDAKLVTPEQVQTLLQVAKERGATDPSWQRDYEWFAIAVNTGLRLSEVAHIEKQDVLPTRLIVTRRKKRHLHPEPIEVMPTIHKLIHERAARVEDGFIFPGNAQPCIIYRQSKKNGPSEEQVCCGGHSSLRTIQRRWRILVTELHMYMHGRGIHSLRHTAITAMYKMTKDIRKAQVFAGHSSSTITERYAHVVDLAESLAVMKPLI